MLPLQEDSALSGPQHIRSSQSWDHQERLRQLVLPRWLARRRLQCPCSCSWRPTTKREASDTTWASRARSSPSLYSWKAGSLRKPEENNDGQRKEEGDEIAAKSTSTGRKLHAKLLLVERWLRAKSRQALSVANFVNTIAICSREDCDEQARAFWQIPHVCSFVSPYRSERAEELLRVHVWAGEYDAIQHLTLHQSHRIDQNLWTGANGTGFIHRSAEPAVSEEADASHGNAACS